MTPVGDLQDAEHWLRLCLVPGVPGRVQRALLKAFGSPGAIMKASTPSLVAIAGQSVAEALARGPDTRLLEETLAWLSRPAQGLVTLADSCYPPSLLDIPDPPTLLYCKGDPKVLARPGFAIVGSRNATRQGMIDAHAFAVALSDAGYPIVSGLALGIDAAAHRGGLGGTSRSIAIVGTGPDRLYPAANRPLAIELADQGAILSEFPVGTPPSAANFPRRNRLISGMSRGVLVVEAALKSGSLTTARLALEQGRDVFAIPGSIHSPLSKGCHWLIKQGAKLVECADDVISELGTPGPRRQPTVDGCDDRPNFADGDADPVLKEIGDSPVTVDSIAARTSLQASDVVARLLRLELDGTVERLPGGHYRRLHGAT